MVKNITKRIKKYKTFPRISITNIKTQENVIEKEIVKEDVVEEVIEEKVIVEEVVKPKKNKSTTKINNETEKPQNND